MLSHIVAASENNVIGIQNGLPWKLANDFKYFKNKTWGLPVIMGRNTYESLQKDLPGRINIVLTGKTGWQPEKVIIAHSFDEALSRARDSDAKEIFIIGGGQIFRETFLLVDRVYLTRVHTTLEGDTFYPEIDPARWKLTSSQSFDADGKNNYPYTFEIWDSIGKV